METLQYNTVILDLARSRSGLDPQKPLDIWPDQDLYPDQVHP